MSVRRLITFVIGVWLGGSLLVAFVATHNLRSVEASVASLPPAAAKLFESADPNAVPMLLRHQAGELNRFYFDFWELVQLGLGALVLGLILFATSEGKWMVALAAVMTLAVAAQHLLITPDLINFGRQLDFLAEPSAAERARFAALHRIYGLVELLKWALGALLLGLLLRRRQGKRRRIGQVDAVDDGDHAHVDG